MSPLSEALRLARRRYSRAEILALKRRPCRCWRCSAPPGMGEVLVFSGGESVLRVPVTITLPAKRMLHIYRVAVRPAPLGLSFRS